MNKQGKNGIEWCDYTWNPVTGCYHECGYCYARRIANRFTKEEDYKHFKETFLDGWKGMHEVVAPVENNGRKVNYPFKFEPTLHRYRLFEPKNTRKPSKIFVSSMGELFGKGVPWEWIEKVFEACKKAPQHTYMFLTKNPDRYCDLYNDLLLPHEKNFWFGSTITKDEDNFAFDKSAKNPDNNYFLSIEPLLEEINLKEYYLRRIKWIIIGAQTGPNSIVPNKEWVSNIIDLARKVNVPIFTKDNLCKIYPELKVYKEFPKGLAQA